MPLRLLLVEDDEDTASAIGAELSRRGNSVHRLGDGSGVAAATRGADFDAMVLDRLLPDGDGATMLRDWRDLGVNIPVILLTGLGSARERVEGLRCGADDYLAKPFEVEELVARLDALVRHNNRAARVAKDVLRCGSIEIDRMRRELRRSGRLIALQPRELKLAEELALHQGQIVSRQALLQQVWNLRIDPGTKLIETHMSRLRSKLDDGEHTIDPIETVRGRGYRLRPDA